MYLQALFQIISHILYILKVSKLYSNKRPYTVNTCMSRKDLDDFKLDVQRFDLPALLDKNLNADPNTNLNIIQNVLTNAKRANSPKKTKRLNKYNCKKSPWVTKGIIKSIKTRDKLYRELKKTLPHSQKITYKKIARIIIY